MSTKREQELAAEQDRLWKAAAAAACADRADHEADPEAVPKFGADAADDLAKRAGGRRAGEGWRAASDRLFAEAGISGGAGSLKEGRAYLVSPYHVKVRWREGHPMYDARVRGVGHPDHEDMKSLAASIAAVGVNHTVEITTLDGKEIDAVDGRRRLTGVRMSNGVALLAAAESLRAGRAQARPPALVMEVNALAKGIRAENAATTYKNIGNLHNAGESASRAAQGVLELQRANHSAPRIAALTGYSIDRIGQLLALAKLCPDLQAEADAGRLSPPLWIPLSKIPGAKKQLNALERARAGGRLPGDVPAAIDAIARGAEPEPVKPRAPTAVAHRRAIRRFAEGAFADPDAAETAALAALAVAAGDRKALERLPPRVRALYEEAAP